MAPDSLTSPTTTTEAPELGQMPHVLSHRVLATEVAETAGDGRIPKHRYTSAEFLQREAEKLWPNVWQLACREEELSAVGDYVEYTIADESILLVRTPGSGIKAFHNSCRHRGTQLKEGCGNSSELKCPYHFWSWNLDGSIKEVTDAHDFPPECITPDRLALPECLVDVWSGFVFINMNLEAPPLLEFLGVIPERLGRYDFGRMRLASAHSTVINANWKAANDAFMEAYHLLAIHPQMLLYIDDTQFTYEQYGPHGLSLPGRGSFGTPSKRLNGYEPDRRETILALMEDMGATDIYGSDEFENVKELVLQAAGDLPDNDALPRPAGQSLPRRPRDEGCRHPAVQRFGSSRPRGLGDLPQRRDARDGGKQHTHAIPAERQRPRQLHL